MPTVLFDQSSAQFKRWLLRNSPAIPIAILIALAFVLSDNDTLHIATAFFGCVCLFIMFWGAIFRRILLYLEDGQIVMEYSFLGLFTVERRVEAITNCSFVRYHTFQRPWGRESFTYHGAIYLHFSEGQPWRISDQGNYSMDLECDEFQAEQLARTLGVPVEKVQNDPSIPEGSEPG
ncbi:MAG TPA: hypothetical protein PLN21_00925 [Gemmatales bacterium]|nr:hypothetical protein [Gemmatales bacterium]